MGHLEAVYYLFGYLKAHDQSTMVFDSEYIDWRDEDFPIQDWTDFYKNVEEDIPRNVLDIRVHRIEITTT